MLTMMIECAAAAARLTHASSVEIGKIYAIIQNRNFNISCGAMAQQANQSRETPERHFRFSVDRGGTFTDM
jgi:hypothetical protein